MSDFSINNGNSTTYTDTTPGGGFVIDFYALDNSFSLTINGVDLFVGGPAGAPNELQFQTAATEGQTVRFADGTEYGNGIPEIWQMGNTNGEPIVRLVVNPDGTIALSGVKSTNGPLEPLELFNGLTVNTAAIAAAWNPAGPNTAVLDQSITGPTNASGEIEDILCFASGTLIETRDGPVPVEKLRENDAVLTYDNGYQPVRWIGSTRLTAQQLEVHPRLRPILIRANALGPGYPRQDLRVSPQHRILVSSAVAERMFGNHDVLIPANKLLGLKGIEVETDNPDGVEYWHILFEEHQIIWSNGSPTESLFVGPEALKSVSDAARQELQTLFPVLAAPDFEPLSVRKIPQKGKMVRKLIKRHRENNKPVYSKDSELLGA